MLLLSWDRHVFKNQLRRPPIEMGVTRDYWGICIGLDNETARGTSCLIKISDKYFCPQWFMNVLAHEMAHQYQWDIYRWDHQDYHGREMYKDGGAHGPSFFMWRERFDHYGLNLKTAHGQRRWFKWQDFNKC